MPWSSRLVTSKGQDHGHRRIRLPPKEAVAEVRRSSKGKRAIAVTRPCGRRHSNLHGERFWARGYAVSTGELRTCRVAPRSSSRSNSPPKDRMHQASFTNVVDDPGSSEGCSQPSSPCFAGAL